MASTESATAPSSARSTRNASIHRSDATAVMTVVPLMSASPSLGANRMGARPAAASASTAARRRPWNSASPIPTSTRAMYAEGIKSPLAPTEPYRGTTGVTPRFSSAASASTISGRTAEAPVTKVATRSSVAVRTTSPGSGCPVAQERCRTRLSCRRSIFSGGSEIPTFPPTPVFTP
jgi:hypothetical protein